VVADSALCLQGNSRGNTWSRAHATLSADDPRFWDFSWDDMAAFDLPALVNGVLQHTGHARLSYIGMTVFPACNMLSVLTLVVVSKRLSLFWMKTRAEPVAR